MSVAKVEKMMELFGVNLAMRQQADQIANISGIRLAPHVIARIRDEIAIHCARTFTEEEMDAMIDYHNSPCGQSIAKKMPEFTRRSMEIGARLEQGLEP